jgi:hypothetical protein
MPMGSILQVRAGGAKLELAGTKDSSAPPGRANNLDHRWLGRRPLVAEVGWPPRDGFALAEPGHHPASVPEVHQYTVSM